MKSNRSVFGCIFAGAVHDFYCGMISMRHDGASISELSGQYLGNGMRWVVRVFSVILLVLIGGVFTTGPAGLLDILTNGVPLILDKDNPQWTDIRSWGRIERTETGWSLFPNEPGEYWFNADYADGTSVRFDIIVNQDPRNWIR